MSQLRVVTDKDIGFGLEIEAGKLQVKVEDLAIPVDVKLQGVDIDKDGKVMTFTLSDGSTIERDIADFLAVDTDTTLVSGSYADQAITLVDSEGNEVKIELADLVKEINDVNDAADVKIDEAKKELQDQIDELKAKKPTGIQVLSLGDVELGYLVSKDDVA